MEKEVLRYCNHISSGAHVEVCVCVCVGGGGGGGYGNL